MPEPREAVKINLVSRRNTEIPALFSIPAAEKYPVVLAVHGFSSSKSEYGLYDELARQLSAKGIGVLRIDFPGCGESPEPFTAYTFRNMLDDMETAFDFLNSQQGADPDRFALQGYSMGGRMASLFWNQHPEIKTISMWAPGLANGTDLAVSFAGGWEAVFDVIADAKQTGVFHQHDEWGGHEIGYEFFHQALKDYPYEILGRYDGDLFIACGDSDHIIPLNSIRMAVLCAEKAKSVQTCIIPGGDHDFGTGFGVLKTNAEITEQLLSSTVSFLTRALL